MPEQTNLLNYQAQIVDAQGRPTPYFIRQWQVQMSVNGDVSVALSTAQGAQETAEAADTKADQGIAAAAVADGKAVAAQSTANQAVTDAATADGKAVNAQSTADQAVLDAAAAQSTADDAETAASDNASDISDILDISFNAGTGLSVSGDLTAGPVQYSLANTAVTAGTYGSATMVPVLTVDAQGRVTSASEVAVSGGGGGGGGGAVSARGYVADGLSTSTTAAAAKGRIWTPAIDVDVYGLMAHLYNVIGITASDLDFYIFEDDSGSLGTQVATTVSTGTVTLSDVETGATAFGMFASEVTLSAGTAYVFLVVRTDSLDNSAIQLARANGTGDAAVVTLPGSNTEGFVYVIDKAPAATDSYSTDAADAAIFPVA